MIKIEKLNKKTKVFDINVENNHNFYANDILVHNCQEINLPQSPIYDINDGEFFKQLVRVKNENLDFFNSLLTNGSILIDAKKSTLHNIIYKNDIYKYFEIVNDVDSNDTEHTYINADFEYVYGDKQSEISLCVLGAINLGVIKGLDELEEVCEYTVRMLDYVIDVQDYPVIAAKKMMKRRSLGVGVTNFAYWLAKNNLNYSSSESLVEIDRLFEHIQFNLLKASNKLAKEYGKCEYFDRTKYSQGLLPIDHYNKTMDTVVKREFDCDWDGLRNDIKEFGLRNSVVSAQMPCESCVTKDTKIILENGDIKSYEEIFSEQNIDLSNITNGEPRWIEFNKPFNVRTKDGIDLVERFWYNGEKEVYDIEFEDGKVYKMTANHRLLVNRNNEQVWVRCDELLENDDVVNVLTNTLKIKSIKKSENVEHTFDIEVKNEHNYIFDNGCVSHNSSVVSNSTNGIEAPRSLITVKKSKSGGPLPVVVPEVLKLKNKYQFSWGFSNDDMNKLVGIIQKYFDQGISVNHYYDKKKYEDGNIPLSEVAKDLMNFYKLGGKQIYYANSKDYKSDKLEDMFSAENLNDNKLELVAEIGDNDCGDSCTI